MLGPILSHPKLWVTAATFLALLGAKRMSPPVPQTITVALLISAALVWQLTFTRASRSDYESCVGASP
jgi:hypothetical protein